MVTLEEMTRRRDQWRREAELLAEQLLALQTRYDQEVPELADRWNHETVRRMTAETEAAAMLAWVRTLQREVSRLNYELGSPGV